MKQSNALVLWRNRPKANVPKPKPEEKAQNAPHLLRDERIRPNMLRGRRQDKAPSRFLSARAGSLHSKKSLSLAATLVGMGREPKRQNRDPRVSNSVTTRHSEQTSIQTREDPYCAHGRKRACAALARSKTIPTGCTFPLEAPPDGITPPATSNHDVALDVMINSGYWYGDAKRLARCLNGLACTEQREVCPQTDESFSSRRKNIATVS